MKYIEYGVLGYRGECDQKTEIVATVQAPYSEENLSFAKERAYQGKYTIVDDGERETATQADRIEAQVTYTAMMTDTLLEV